MGNVLSGYQLINLGLRPRLCLLCIPFGSTITSSGDGFRSRHRKRRFSQRAGGGYQPIQMASWPPVLPEPTSVRTAFRTNEENGRIHEPWNIYRANQEAHRTNEFQSIYRTNKETCLTNEFQSICRTKEETCGTNDA